MQCKVDYCSAAPCINLSTYKAHEAYESKGNIQANNVHFKAKKKLQQVKLAGVSFHLNKAHINLQ